METEPVSNGDARRGWFGRLPGWKKAGVLLSAFVVALFILTLLGAMLSRAREAAPLRFAGSPALEVKTDVVADRVPAPFGAGSAVTEAAKPATQTAIGSLPALETWDRQLILTAVIALEVGDVRAAYDRIQMLAAGEGAVITAASLQAGSAPDMAASGEKDYGRATVVLRVPQSRFQAVRRRLLDAASDLEGKVLRDEVSSEDVTEEYVDLQARLRNWRAQEVQLLEIMRQARTIPDILAVREKLSEVQGEIERLSGRLRFLENRVELSTITVELSQKGKGPASVTIASTWKNAGKAIAAAAVQSLKNVVYALGLLAVAVVYVFPFAAIAGIIWGGVRAVRRRAQPAPVK
jgi:hypothetical protein